MCRWLMLIEIVTWFCVFDASVLMITAVTKVIGIKHVFFIPRLSFVALTFNMESKLFLPVKANA